MENTTLDFSFNMEGLDRQALLREAAERLDLRRAHLGEEDSISETPEGELARALLNDVAEFADFPVVYKITDKDFLKRNLEVPVRFQQLARDYNFYWLYFPIALFPKHNWAFNRLELVVEFNPDDPAPHTRPKAYQILPEKKFQTLLEMSDHLEVSLDENFEFKAKAATPELQADLAEGKIGGGVEVKYAGGMGLVVGPFVYRLKRAKIDHTPTGMQKVFWRLDGAEFFQENNPAIVVITQIPKETKEVKVAAAMQAYRYFNYASAGLQQAVEELVKSLKRFFKDGLPIRDEKTWDITPRL